MSARREDNGDSMVDDQGIAAQTFTELGGDFCNDRSRRLIESK